jgi:hypothetical protein
MELKTARIKAEIRKAEGQKNSLMPLIFTRAGMRLKWNLHFLDQSLDDGIRFFTALQGRRILGADDHAV